MYTTFKCRCIQDRVYKASGWEEASSTPPLIGGVVGPGGLEPPTYGSGASTAPPCRGKGPPPLCLAELRALLPTLIFYRGAIKTVTGLNGGGVQYFKAEGAHLYAEGGCRGGCY